MKITTKLWLGIMILIILSPLGLWLPEHFKAGAAWGEWGASSLWSAPLPDYTFKGWEGKGLGHLSLAYCLSAGLGVVIVVLLIWFIAKMLIKK